jgi:hypothetical protein
MKKQSNIHNAMKALVFAAVVSAVPLEAEDFGPINAALASHNYSSAIALTKQAFASVKSAKEASDLLRSILAVAPRSKDSALVVAAIEGNSNLVQAILATVMNSLPKDEAGEILSSVYATLVENANPSLAAIANRIAGTTSEVLTMPTFNPANSVGVGVTLSPSTPGSP